MLAAAVTSLRDAVVELNPGLLPHNDWVKALSRDLDEREEQLHPIASPMPIPHPCESCKEERHKLTVEVNRLNTELSALKTQQPYRDEEMKQAGRVERDSEVAELRGALVRLAEVVEEASIVRYDESGSPMGYDTRFWRLVNRLRADTGRHVAAAALSVLDHEPSEPTSLQSAKPQP